MLKFVYASLMATSCSILASVIVLLILGFIVNIFKLNYGRDAYWVFSVAFITFIASWIVVFGIFVSNDKELAIRRNLSDPINYLSSTATGTVESIHIGGRTEVVPVVQVELTKYFHEENLWELSGGLDNGIVQPQGRKNYFIPVLTGKLNTKYGSAQLIEVSNVGWENEKHSEFRVANIMFKDDKPVSVLFRHYNYEDGKWKEIAGYEATFD